MPWAQALVTLNQSALVPEEWFYPPTLKNLFQLNNVLSLRKPFGNAVYVLPPALRRVMEQSRVCIFCVHPLMCQRVCLVVLRPR